jgi:hypothetical protein
MEQYTAKLTIDVGFLKNMYFYGTSESWGLEMSRTLEYSMRRQKKIKKNQSEVKIREKNQAKRSE